MLSLYIGSAKGWITDSSGDPIRVYPVYYKKGEESLELRFSTSLPPLDNVEIFFQWWKYFIRLPVSEKLRTAILNFMIFKHLVEDRSYNCYSFACEYARVPQHAIEEMLTHWRLKPKRGWARAGEVVFFCSPVEDSVFFHHAAIHLGFGRYLSVWGGGGQFEVASLKDMRTSYRAQWIFTALAR